MAEKLHCQRGAGAVADPAECRKAVRWIQETRDASRAALCRRIIALPTGRADRFSIKNARKRKTARRRLCSAQRYNQRRRAVSRRERIFFVWQGDALLQKSCWVTEGLHCQQARPILPPPAFSCFSRKKSPSPRPKAAQKRMPGRIKEGRRQRWRRRTVR